MEALTEFIHVYYSDGLSNTLLFRDHVLETTPSTGMMDGMYIPRAEEEMKRLIAGPSSGVNQKAHLLNDLLQQLNMPDVSSYLYTGYVYMTGIADTPS